MLIPIAPFDAQKAIDADTMQQQNFRFEVERIRTAGTERFADIAESILGSREKHLSKPMNIRFGKKGSIMIDLNTGSYANFETNEGGDVIAFIMHTYGIGFGAAIDWLKSYLGSGFSMFSLQKHRNTKKSSSLELDRKARIAEASQIYDRADYALNDDVITYLSSRNCDMPDNGCIRSSPPSTLDKYFTYTYAPLRCLKTQKFSGVHITKLSLPHRWYAPKNQQIRVSDQRGRIIKGVQSGAIILLKGRIVQGHIAIGEGIETALSIDGEYDCVLSAINAGNLGKLVMPAGVHSVSIFADNDRAGLAASKQLKTTCIQQGIMCEIFIPPDGYNDFNDLRKSKIKPARCRF